MMQFQGFDWLYAAMVYEPYTDYVQRIATIKLSSFHDEISRI